MRVCERAPKTGERRKELKMQDESEKRKKEEKTKEIVSHCLSVAKKYFSEDQIKAAVAEFSRGISCCDNRNWVYYDGDRKKFFRVFADGNYYHGYEVSYPLMNKEEAIQWEADSLNILQYEEQCAAGEVPLFLILLLPNSSPIL